MEIKTTPQHSESLARAYPFILAVLGAVLIVVLYVNLETREMTAQEVFGVDMDFDDI